MVSRGVATIAVVGYALVGPARSITRFGVGIGIIVLLALGAMEKCISFWIVTFLKTSILRVGAFGLNDVGTVMMPLLAVLMQSLKISVLNTRTKRGKILTSPKKWDMIIQNKNFV